MWRLPPSQIKHGKRLGCVSKGCDPLGTGGLQEPNLSKATRQGILHPRKRLFGKTYTDLEKEVSQFKGYGHMFFSLPDWISLWTEDGFCQAPGGLGRGTTSTWWVEWGRWEILTFFCLLCSLCVYIYIYVQCNYIYLGIHVCIYIDIIRIQYIKSSSCIPIYIFTWEFKYINRYIHGMWRLLSS